MGYLTLFIAGHGRGIGRWAGTPAPLLEGANCRRVLGGVRSRWRIFSRTSGIWQDRLVREGEIAEGGRFLSGCHGWKKRILNRQGAKDAKELKAGMLEGAFSVFWSWISIVLGELFCVDRAWEFAVGGSWAACSWRVRALSSPSHW